MSTISANVFIAKIAHQCVNCNRNILPGEQYMRLYGFAETCDPIETYHFHLRCLLGTKPDKKMIAAFVKKNVQYKLRYDLICEIIVGDTQYHESYLTR